MTLQSVVFLGAIILVIAGVVIQWYLDRKRERGGRH